MLTLVVNGPGFYQYFHPYGNIGDRAYVVDFRVFQCEALKSMKFPYNERVHHLLPSEPGPSFWWKVSKASSFMSQKSHRGL